MNDIARGPESLRKDLFRETANRMKVSEAIIEKDFWVCWTLGALFSSLPWKDKLIFKGGTSLSKVFHLINRFSEDIDLVLDWRTLGYSSEDPWLERSNTKQQGFVDATTEKTIKFLGEDFVPAFSRDIEERLGVKLSFTMEKDVVLISYPKAFDHPAILPQIKLEIGPLASWTPHGDFAITPYSAEQFPSAFDSPTVPLKAVTVERTFWEKATILHQEAHRSEGKPQPLRYSRHYYDLFRISQSKFKATALGNLQLLKAVVEFKEKFYRTPWAHLKTASPPTLKLVPPSWMRAKLEADYQGMKDMLFDEVIPTFASQVGVILVPSTNSKVASCRLFRAMLTTFSTALAMRLVDSWSRWV